MEKLERYIENFRKLIQVKTISHYTDENMTPFYEFHDVLKNVFPNIFSVCTVEDFDGSLLIRWKGTKNKMPVLFMNHFDVVDVQKEGWSCDPFDATVKDGKLYGRGTLDTKGGLWATLQAADDLAKEGFQPEMDIYFESSCNEETTFVGARKISNELIKRGVRFSFVLDEGGMIKYEPISGVKGTFAMVGMGERGCADLLFTANGCGGHASSPEYDTPLVRLGKFMSEADRTNKFKREISPVIREMFKRFASSVEGPLKTIYSRPELFDTVLKEVMPKTSGTAKALLQTTIAFTMAEGSEGRNIIPTKASVIGNMRVSHHQGYKASLEAIEKIARKYDIETTVLDPAMDSKLADFNSPQYALIEKAVKYAHNGVESVPYIMTGCSDARFMDPLTDNCFHFVPFLIDERQLESIHGIDECVDVSTLIPAVEFYRYLMTEGDF